MDLEHALQRCALWSIWASGLPTLMARRHAGHGGILSFHRVGHPAPRMLGSQALSVTPENFRCIVQTLIGRGYRFLSMSGLADWLQAPETKPGKFVCLTFDDGFICTHTQAFPICRELGVPMTVYLVSGFVRREFPMWWLGLEAALAVNDVVKFTWESRQLQLAARTDREKRKVYSAIASRLATAPPAIVRQVCTELELRYGIDFGALGDRNVLTPSMITEMHASGLVEFGAHSVHHACLGRLDDYAARQEIAQSKHDCETLLGGTIRHFAYPYGDSQAAGAREAAFCRDLGFQTAVTTESNTIFASDRARPFLLPRLTLNGRFQGTPLLDLLLSGALPRLRRGLRARREGGGQDAGPTSSRNPRGLADLKAQPRPPSGVR